PARKGGEGDAARRVVPLEGAQQPHDPFLEQVGLLESLGPVAARRRVDERQQPPDQLLSRRVVSRLGAAGERVRFVAGDRLRGFGLVPQLLRGGVAAVPPGAFGQLPLHGHAPIVPHGYATAARAGSSAGRSDIRAGRGGSAAAATRCPVAAAYSSIAFFPAPPIVILFGFCSAGFGIRNSSTP